MEFLRSIALGATVGDEIRLSHAFIQPIAAEDVADAVTAVALAAPVNGKIELGGPEKFHLDEIVAQTLALDTDPPPIVVDPRSEEHTFELQSLMLISYAVFCLK